MLVSTKEKQALRKSLRPTRKTGTEKKRPEGLCANCCEAPGCSLTSGSSTVIHQCEEFRSEEECARGTGAQCKASPDPFLSQCEKPELAGLCVNCSQRETCCFPKPHGGVWHCQEYC